MRIAKSMMVLACIQLLCGCPGGDGDGDAAGEGGASGASSSGSGGASGASGMGSSGASGASGVGGGGTGGGGGVPSTGLPSTTPLSALTADQAQAACESLRAGFDNAFSDDVLARYSCTVFASISSIINGPDGMPMVDQAACEAAVDACLMDASVNPGMSTTTDECTPEALMNSVMDCSATAGELDACFSATIAQFDDLISMVNCTAPISLSGPTMQPESPAACMQLEMKCPGILDELSTSTGLTPPDLGEGGDGDGDGGGDGDNGGPGGCDDSCGGGNGADGFCDDGGPGSDLDICPLGTDCTDCGERPMN